MFTAKPISLEAVNNTSEFHSIEINIITSSFSVADLIPSSNAQFLLGGGGSCALRGVNIPKVWVHFSQTMRTRLYCMVSISDVTSMPSKQGRCGNSAVALRVQNKRDPLFHYLSLLVSHYTSCKVSIFQLHLTLYGFNITCTFLHKFPSTLRDIFQENVRKKKTAFVESN